MQLMPLVVGIILLFAGNLGISIINNIPLDITSGILNAVLMFWMLYSGHVFKLTLLVSRGNCYILAMGVSVLVFFNMAQGIDTFIRNQMPYLTEYSVMIVAVLTMLLTLTLYTMMKALFDRLFIQEEQKQNQKLSEYTMLVSKSLEMNEIYRALVNVITETLHVKKIYISVGEADGSFRTAYSTSPLDDNRFFMQPDHPLIGWLKENNGCLLLTDFKRTVEYKSMWEDEKRYLDDLHVNCFLPLKDGEELVGIVMLSEKDKKHKNFTIDDISFLNSLESVSSIALKNSRLYERAYREARTDDLTGLLNRKCFYETLDEVYSKNGNNSMSLIIFNIDDFKLYNQLYGNYEGDMALC
ncbi:MAG: diguanylate cyclase, partial [Lachnospiraceae bacterium]|nr:diguanylate cyclase [Lachnospiraceae bacterium]